MSNQRPQSNPSTGSNKDSVNRASINIHSAIFSDSMQQSITFKRTLSIYSSWLIALVLHALLFVVAIRTEESLESWSGRMATLIHSDLAAQALVSVESVKVPVIPKVAPPNPMNDPPSQTTPPPIKQAPPPPTPKTPRLNKRGKSKVKKSKKRLRKAISKEIKKSAPTEKQAPAQAAKIIASDQTAEPVDLTGAVFVTGDATKYAGGVTTSDGSSTRFVEKAEIVAQAEPSRENRPSQASPVQLSAGAWRCAWPQKAMSRDIYEHSVVLRVEVNTQGKVTKANVVSGARDGFGEAAVNCALRTRFTPAKNRDGRVIQAKSPPIKVRFTR